LVIAAGLALTLGASTAFAAVVPTETAVSARKFANSAIDVQTSILPAADSARLADLDAMMIPTDGAFIDPATGRWATLLPTQPLIPGSGVTNNLTWAVAPESDDDIAAAAEAAFVDYVRANASELRLDTSEFASELNVSVNGDTVLIHVPRVIDGVPVRNSFVTGTISHGNLILMGAARWADMNVSAQPTIGEEAARVSLDGLIGDLPIDGSWGDTELVIVPASLADGALGYRLAYSMKPQFDNELGNWEGLVDAHSGELLSFFDTNHYASRHVVGGVYPVSNDGDGPDGNEQAGYAMPYADLSSGGSSATAGRNGEFPGEFAGTVTTNLDSDFVDINDSCGSINESSTGLTSNIDLGVSGGDDCVTPPGGSNGNTHSARTTYYHVNRAAEWARERSSANWLGNTLTADVNINSNCNAFWDGNINMYRSGSGCGNTGEIAGVVNHEWGHGVDDNDNNPNISFPGEGIADLYAMLTTGDSCIGRGFFDNGNCSGYGDPCIDCSGIRDIDFAQRQSGTPHDAAWGEANCGGCGIFATVHCLGAVYAEAVWDLKARDLPAAGQDSNQAHTLTSYLTLIGASNVGDWFTCNGNGQDGCSGESGYMNYIAADDTNGTLSDGTPHMSAIFDAFDRHGIACSTPNVQDAGCAGAPTQAPNVTATAGDGEVSLSWNAVPGTFRYQVYRSEGINACNQGKLLIATVDGTSFTDTGLLHGFDYHYSVAALAVGRTCISPMSTCDTVTTN